MRSHSRHVALLQVAVAAGVSLAAASYSLRNDPRIPRATATRVQAIARRLGYWPNPRVSALMAHIRRGRPVTGGERIAFLWIDAPPGKRPYRDVFEAAKRRALQLGYTLEEFWRSSPGISDRRLQQIISTRGITGLLISPSYLADPRFKLDWDWSMFAPAIIGTAESVPELHHSAHHHYEGMRLILSQLKARGRRRIVGILDKSIEERARRGWSASFIAHHPMPQRASEFLRQEDPQGIGDLALWIRRRKPEAIATKLFILESLAKNGWTPPPQTDVLLLDWRPNPMGFGGINQCYPVIAANAVDLVANQLQLNERGAPKHVKMLLSTGRWVAGKRDLAASKEVIHSSSDTNR